MPTHITGCGLPRRAKYVRYRRQDAAGIIELGDGGAQAFGHLIEAWFLENLGRAFAAGRIHLGLHLISSFGNTSEYSKT
jgi:hypothetical protein